jgi:chemotaxis protein CheC
MSTEIAPLSEVERDALCELANIAMARAAMSIRRMVGRQILLSVPSCDILAPEAAAATLTKPGNPLLVAVRQDFSGVFTGHALLIFPEQSSLELMHAILGREIPPADILDLEDEALAETGNIILNSWVGTVANLLKQSFKMSLPIVIRRDQRHIFQSVVVGESVVLFLHIKFEVSEQKMQGYVALIMDLPSIELLRTLIAEFLTSLG